MGALARLKNITELKREVPTSHFIPYGNHVSKNIIKLKSGDYLAVFRLQGAAHESADAADINSWHLTLNNFMKNIASPNVALWTHTIRRKFNEFPGGEFENAFCRNLNEKYKAHTSASEMLINELYVSFVYRPAPGKLSKLLEFRKKTGEAAAEQQAEEIEYLEDLIQKAEAGLDRYEPKVLGCYEFNGIMFSEAQEFLAYLVDNKWRRQPLTRKDIRHGLCTSRPYFGKGGLLTFKNPEGANFGSALVIENYCGKTYPGILNGLLGLPFEFVMAQSFTFISKTLALKSMEMQLSRLTNSGDVAVSQQQEIIDAMDDIQSNLYVLGTHHMSLIVTADDHKLLGANTSLAGSVLSDAGIKYAREDIGLAGCFWSQLPGNFQYRVRASDITSLNFAGFSCLHNYPIGRIRGAQWGEAVTMFKTTSGSPYYFNYHKVDNNPEAKFDPNHFELGHFSVIGPSGSGKTVIENFLLSQTQKFRTATKKLTAVLFDKDLGASIAVKAMGGRYYAIKNGVPSGWNPLQLEPTPKNLGFLENWLKLLVARNGAPLTDREEKDLYEALLAVVGHNGDPEKDVPPRAGIPKPHRRLSAILEFFDPTDESGLYARLEKWCEGRSLGWLFDNDVDLLELSDSPIIGFDVTEFLDNEETRAATILYLMHRIDGLIDGRRIPIFMDEFWRLILDEAFCKLIGDKLVTMRKQDGILGMFTQSPKQITQSSIANAIIEQTATNIFLPNPKANKKDYVDDFKMTVAEYEIIKNLPEKSRKFLIKQNGNSVVVELNLRGFDDELAVLSANTASAKMVEDIISEVGEDPDIWLPIFHRRRKGLAE